MQIAESKPKKAEGISKKEIPKGGLFFQPKLAINAPGDAYEQEADAMGEHVMRVPDKNFHQSFFKPAISSIQRKCAHCAEEEKQMQRKENSSAEKNADNSIENYVNNLNGKGKALDELTRSFFEPKFGHDFSNVKIHDDAEAAASAKSINALAYTVGNNIVFGSNQFQSQSDQGKKLLAHELTHVVQQTNGIKPKMIQRYPWPYPLHRNREVSQSISETISGAPAAYSAWNGTYTWDSHFRIELSAVTGTVSVIMRLYSTAPLAIRRAWERAIERKWSGRLYLRIRVPGVTEGPCKLKVLVNLQWVNDPARAHYTINPQAPGTTSSGRAGIGGTSSMTDWGTADTTDITHEFGHMLGNPEEYFTTNGTNYATAGRAGFRDPGGGIMNNPAERVHSRHFNLVREQVALMLGISASRVSVIYNNDSIPDCIADIGDFPTTPITNESTVAV
jgi:hypothetical protein